jgi:hypothetical protein
LPALRDRTEEDLRHRRDRRDPAPEGSVGHEIIDLAKEIDASHRDGDAWSLRRRGAALRQRVARGRTIRVLSDPRRSIAGEGLGRCVSRGDALTRILVVAAAIAYALWAAGIAMTTVSTTAIGVVVFALGWAARVTNQREIAVVCGVDRTKAPTTTVYTAATTVLGTARPDRGDRGDLHGQRAVRARTARRLVACGLRRRRGMPLDGELGARTSRPRERAPTRQPT